MTKKELIAAILELDPERKAAALKKENVADLTMLYEELKPAPRVVAFRERPEVREHIDAFKEHRTDLFQPAVYSRDEEKLESALREMLTDIRNIAEAADVTL